MLTKLRRLFALLLLLLLSQSVFCQQSEPVSYSETWDSVELSLQELSNSLLQLQTNNSVLQIQLKNVEQSLQTQRNFLASQSLQLESYKQQSESYARSLKRWKIYSLVTTVAVIGLTTTVIVMARRQ